MRTRWIGAIVVLAATSVSLQSHTQSPSKHADVADSDYQVLSVYITDMFIGKTGEDRVDAHVTRIVIANKTQSDRRDRFIQDENEKRVSWSRISRYLRKQSPILQSTTLDSFRDMNADSSRLDARFQLSLPYELVDKTEFDAIFKNKGWWPDYYKKYPNSQGFLILSRVGFSADGKQAMFYSVNMCGGTCGAGTYVVMEKVGANWRVAKEIAMWES